MASPSDVIRTYFGTSGSQPGIWGMPLSGESRRLANVEPGHSLYSLALSPEGPRLVIGTRNRANQDHLGLVRIWDRSPDGSLPATPRQSWYQPVSVTTVEMPTEDTVVSGGVDGQLFFWRLGQERVEGTVLAHQGPVLACRAVAHNLLATLGGDGALRMWQLDTRTCIWQHSPRDGNPIGASASIQTAPDLGLFVSLFPDGTLTLTRINESFRTEIAPIGPVLAFGLDGNDLLSADAQGLEMRRYRLPSFEAVGKARLPKAIFTIIPLQPGLSVFIYRDGSASLWETAPSLGPRQALPLGDLRGGAGPSRQILLQESKDLSEREREALLNAAKEAISAGRFDLLQEHLDRLNREGMPIQASVFLAESFLAQGRPLWALRIRTELAKELPNEVWCAPHCYALGELLAKLDEPKRAREAFERCQTLNSAYRDVQAQVASLQNAKDLLPATDTVRDDLPSLDAVRSEVEKQSILGVPWVWTTTLVRKEHPLRFARLDATQLCEHLNRDGESLWRVDPVEAHERGVGIRQTHWAVRDLPGTDGRLQYAGEIRQQGGRALIVHRCCLVPGPAGDPLQVALDLGPILDRAKHPATLQAWEAEAETAFRAADFQGDRGSSLNRDVWGEE